MSKRVKENKRTGEIILKPISVLSIFAIAVAADRLIRLISDEIVTPYIEVQKLKYEREGK